MEVKQQLPHGRFENWVQAECGINIRTAENYIRAAQLAKDKNETVSLLPPSLVYRLASKSAPTEIVEEVLDRAGKGEVIDPREVEDSLRTARREKAKASQKEKKRKQHEASAKARKRREVEEEERNEARRLAEERCQQVAAAILERIGDDGVRFFLDAVRDKFVPDIIRRLEALLAAPQPNE
jgi:chromatin segregation and condensation protein Rec8/ScpA/Scc1 (kleisin family)